MFTRMNTKEHQMFFHSLGTRRLSEGPFSSDLIHVRPKEHQMLSDHNSEEVVKDTLEIFDAQDEKVDTVSGQKGHSIHERPFQLSALPTDKNTMRKPE